MLFFTSDQHFDHKNIIGYCNRPYVDVGSMNEGLIARHNARVGPNDDVWHLGDFSMNASTMQRVLPQLNGRHRLVVGNHDACHPRHGMRGERARAAYMHAGFIELFERTWVDLPNPIGRALLCHMPSADSNTENDERYASYRPSRDELNGAWLIHGHVHTMWKAVGRTVNVGVDVWDYMPVSVDELVALARRAEPRSAR